MLSASDCAVEHSGPGQRVERRDPQAPVGHAGGDDHRPAADLAPTGHGDRELRALGPQPDSRVVLGHLRVRRVRKDPAVEQHHRRQGASGRPGLSEQALSIRAADGVETERNAVSPEQFAEFV
jgi:hypothetical protein